MPIACEFEYRRPKSMAEALHLLSRRGKKAAVLAGGTDLLVWLKEGLRSPTLVVDIKGLKELRGLGFKAGRLRIGAAVTFSQLLDSKIVLEKFPLLWECAGTVASVGVRNRATLAGNIASAVPSLDGAPALLAYEAVVSLKGAGGSRDLPIADWFTGPKRTALRAGEIVTELTLPAAPAPNGACYVKLGRYRGEDLAQVGVGVLALPGREYRVAFCAVGPVPARARRIEALLRGQELSDPILREAAQLVEEEIQPISDIRASREYRLHMAKVMLARGLRTAADRLARRAGPAYGESVL